MIGWRYLYVIALLGLASAAPAAAQRLLWEQTFAQTGNVGTEGASALALAGNARFLLLGVHAPPYAGPGCRPRFRAYYRNYTLSGTLVRETQGRGLIFGNTDFARTSPDAGWFTAAGTGCVSTGTRRYARGFVQRLTLAGDTGRAWFLGAVPPESFPSAMLAQGSQLITAGYVAGSNLNGQYQQFQLTCSDTLGRVRWQRSYPRLPLSDDYAAALVPTPRNGYLLSGDAYSATAQGFDHYVLETDSAGNFRRARILQPLGPGYNQGSRYDTQCNALALPNGQGYLLSGTADSVRNGLHNTVGYVMRLDTALRVQWVYRHPPALSGTGTTQNYAYRLRLLPNNTVGLLLTDVRGAGTPAVSLAQVDIATGRRVGFYLLLSNAQAVVVPADWQWVGDGTLLLCGQARAAGAIYRQSYVARWDFRGTPLATTKPATAALRPALQLQAYPNPSHDRLTVKLTGPCPAHTRVELLELSTGRVLLTVAVANATAELRVAELAAGVYAGRAISPEGQVLGTCKAVVIH